VPYPPLSLPHFSCIHLHVVIECNFCQHWVEFQIEVHPPPQKKKEDCLHGYASMSKFDGMFLCLAASIGYCLPVFSFIFPTENWWLWHNFRLLLWNLDATLSMLCLFQLWKVQTQQGSSIVRLYRDLRVLVEYELKVMWYCSYLVLSVTFVCDLLVQKEKSIVLL